jgi:NADH-quinone oxidoreductase subunit N
MNTSLEIALFVIMASALLVLMLEAIGNRPARPTGLEIEYEKPHIKLLTLGALFTALFIIFFDLSAQTLLNRRPQLFFDNISCLFLIINTIISVHIGHKTLAKHAHKDVFFLLLASLSLGLIIIWTDYILLKLLGSTAWLLIIAALASKTTEGGKKAEIALKLSYSAVVIFLCLLFSLYFLSFSSPTLALADISFESSHERPAALIGIIFFAIAGLNLAGVAPFSFAHVDCAFGSNLSTSFLIISNSMILGSSFLMDSKNILIAAGPPFNNFLPILGFVLVAGLIISWLRALDQSKIRRCVTYIAASVSPLFCLSLLFGNSALLPKLIFLLALFIFATLVIFALFASLAYLEPLDLPWQTWEDMAGLGRTNQIQAVYLLIALASVAGLPGTLGYFIKLSLIAPMHESGWFNLMIFASIAIGASCTMRFFVFLFSKHAPSDLQNANKAPPYSLLFASIILIILGFFPFVR